MAVVRQTVRERGAVIEDELVRAVDACLARLDARLERPVAFPVREDVALERGKGWTRWYGFAAFLLADASPGIWHLSSPRYAIRSPSVFCSAAYGDDADVLRRGTTPLARECPAGRSSAAIRAAPDRVY